MDEIVTFERMLWGFVVFLNGGLLALLLLRKNHRVFPVFFVYVFLNFLQCFILFGSYRIWGFQSPVSSRLAWGTQIFVSTARAVAVAQICHRVLAKYRGIWALARRMLVATAAVVLLYSWAVARGSWQFAVLNADRGMELAIASVIVALFLFARYYGVAVEPAVRALAIGFFLYSCFYVLNITILERWLYDYVALWNLLGTLSFLASLLLWSWGLRERQSVTTFEPEMLSQGIYRTLAPEINDRLRALNDHLGQFWWAERKRS
jgi:hypothetical protein